MRRWNRRGWTERDPYRAEAGTVPSYCFRLADSFWPTIHATTPPTVIQSPLGINWDREGGYVSLDDAAEYAEAVYREALTNARDRAARRVAEMENALRAFGDDKPSKGGDDA